jgi:hypothetical protein
MPFAVLGLHILLARLCADHAVRTGQGRGWTLLVYGLPAIGSLAYFVVAWLPNPMPAPLPDPQPKPAPRVGAQAPGQAPIGAAPIPTIDPRSALLAARAAFEAYPSAEHQLRLIAALLETGAVPEAIEHCEASLRGSFRSDPQFRLLAARACVEAQRFTDALTHLDAVLRTDAGFRGEAALLLRARCLAALGRQDAAREAYESALQSYGSYEVRVEFEIWALAVGEFSIVERLRHDTDRISAGWSALARHRHTGARQRLMAARDLARRTR